MRIPILTRPDVRQDWNPAPRVGTMPDMSRESSILTPPQVPWQGPMASRPRFLDYFLMLLGCAVSLLLVEWSGLAATPGREIGRQAQTILKLLPHLLFLPQGIILFWPLFYATQRLAGREQGLTAGEWMWGLAWLGALLLAGWACWRHFGQPADLQALQQTVLVVYALFVVTMAVLALIIALIDLVGRWPQPWTHHFCLVLMIWPVFPLAALWLWNITLE